MSQITTQIDMKCDTGQCKAVRRYKVGVDLGGVRGAPLRKVTGKTAVRRVPGTGNSTGTGAQTTSRESKEAGVEDEGRDGGRRAQMVRESRETRGPASF